MLFLARPNGSAASRTPDRYPNLPGIPLPAATPQPGCEHTVRAAAPRGLQVGVVGQFEGALAGTLRVPKEVANGMVQSASISDASFLMSCGAAPRRG
jgi:hypothetical protein